MKRQIIFYGDSNTYGFDPRDFSGGRYPSDIIWTTLLDAALGDGWCVINEGMNGRRLPFPGRYDYVSSLLERLSSDDYFAVMLGSNDILMSEDSGSQLPLRHMESFLEWLTSRHDPGHILIIAPVYAGTADAYEPVYRHFYRESVRMNEGFRLLAAQYGCRFADASGWGVETAYDQLHFSQAGHKTFAEHLIMCMQDISESDSGDGSPCHDLN